MTKKSVRDLVSNRRAFHDYEILESYETGVALLGSEVKSIRTGGGSLQEAYVRVSKGELWLVNCHIAPYSYGGVFNHEERRERKLLMHKKEIEKIASATQEKGLALIPLGMYLKKGRIKLKIGIGKGKKHFDKRKSIQERDEKRRMDQALRQKLS